MNKKNKYRNSVFIVVYNISDKLRYLVLKRQLHWRGWEFPKGKIEILELRRNAVKRELKEETGLVPAKIKRFKEKGKYKYSKRLLDRPEYIGQKYKLFAVEVKEMKVIVDDYEHSDYKWLSYRGALKTLKWPNQKKCLKIVNEYVHKKI